jgi:hypothetical protein
MTMSARPSEACSISLSVRLVHVDLGHLAINSSLLSCCWKHAVARLLACVAMPRGARVPWRARWQPTGVKRSPARVRWTAGALVVPRVAVGTDGSRDADRSMQPYTRARRGGAAFTACSSD